MKSDIILVQRIARIIFLAGFMSKQVIETTELIKKWQDGDSRIFDTLIERVYGEIKNLAHQKLKSEFYGSGMRTTELLNEACILMMGKRDLDWKNRKHFVHAAGLAMYRFLIDEARKRKTKSKGGEYAFVQIGEEFGSSEVDFDKLIRIDEALNNLEKEDHQFTEIVKLRFFAGFTIQETAEILNLSTITVNRKWKFAKAFLQKHLSDLDN